MSPAATPIEEPLAEGHWQLSAPAPTPRPALEQQLRCDVAVIGAGYTGLTAALTVAEAGRSVVVLDALEPGAAASGRNAGQIVPMMWGARRTAAQVATAVGPAMGERMNRLLAQSGRELFDVIDRHGIHCDLQPGFLGLVRSQKSWLRQQTSLRPWANGGGRFELIGREQLRRYVVSPRYAGGIFFPDGGHLNPLSLSRGLATAVERMGGRLFESSRVLSVTADGSRWRVSTERGSLSCETVLVGAGAYADDLFPALRTIGYPVTCGVVATGPLPDRGASILPGSIAVADLDDPAVFAPRVDAQGCLVVSFLVGPRAPDLASALSVITPRLRRAFPHLEIPCFERLWTGRFLVSLDGMPRLVRLDRQVYAACVCNGLGHTVGMSAAREMARLAMGVDESALNLPVSRAMPFRAAGSMSRLLRGVIAPLANRFGA